MSKSNVNPNHYKLAGRERQGEDIAQVRNKQAFAESVVRSRFQAGAVFQKPAPVPDTEPEAATTPTKPAARKTAATRQVTAKRATAKPAAAKKVAAKRGVKKRAAAKRPARPAKRARVARVGDAKRAKRSAARKRNR